MLTNNFTDYSFISHRLLNFWSEVDHASNVPTLKGTPNTIELKHKIKEGDEEKEISTEDPEKPEGRNVIRGQAIMLLRMFPFESDSLDLHIAIKSSRKAELGMEEDTGSDKEDAVVAGRFLKTALDRFRDNHTEVDADGNVRFKKPSSLSLETVGIENTTKGRNYIRKQAMVWLKKNKETNENKTNRDELKALLDESIKKETGQWWKETDKDDKGKSIARHKPELKYSLEASKAGAAQRLKTKLLEVSG